MRYKENRVHFLTEGRNKDGSRDLRILKNRKQMGLCPETDDESV